MNRRRRGFGFTVLELLVVTGVIMILAALLMPAVVQAVEAARSTSCKSKLGNLAKAWHQYHEVYRMLPPAIGGGYYSTGSPSWACRVLPFLEQGALFESVNIDPIHFIHFETEQPNFAPAQRTALNTKLAVLLCPSDPSPYRSGINYRGNAGVGPAVSPDFLGPDSGNGVLRFHGSAFVAFRDVTDGLSATAMLSERCRGSGGNPNAFQDVYWIRTTVPTACYGSADDSLNIAQICADAAGGVPDMTFSGWAWLPNGVQTALYKHGQAPNGSIPDAICGGIHGLVAARSWHPGAVNVALADGSVRSVASTISRALWRTMGTRNGGESLAQF